MPSPQAKRWGQSNQIPQPDSICWSNYGTRHTVGLLVLCLSHTVPCHHYALVCVGNNFAEINSHARQLALSKRMAKSFLNVFPELFSYHHNQF